MANFGQMAGILHASATCIDGHFALRQMYYLAMCASYSYLYVLRTNYWMQLLFLRAKVDPLNSMV